MQPVKLSFSMLKREKQRVNYGEYGVNDWKLWILMSGEHRSWKVL